jgi:biopolymer transport protein ExbB/biopolymer transport protein TolQ
VLYLLLGLSVVSISAMVERWLWFRRRRDDIGALRTGILGALRKEDLSAATKLVAASPSIEGEILSAALKWSHGGPEAVSDVVESETCRVRSELERGLNMLGTLGNNAPFVGLLGTVLGVIEAFHQLGDGANKAAMGNVMGGIAEALVATGVGLFVALPAVVAYNVVQKRIGDVETNVQGLTKLFTAYLKTRSTFEEGAVHEAHLNGAPVRAAAEDTLAGAENGRARLVVEV